MEKEIILETIIDLLKKGNSVELAATGFSMFPTLKPGDRVLINPISAKAFPVTGSIVVYNINNELVIHRLIEIQNIFVEYISIFRG